VELSHDKGNIKFNFLLTETTATCFCRVQKLFNQIQYAVRLDLPDAQVKSRAHGPILAIASFPILQLL
jgi:hypothetical protein